MNKTGQFVNMFTPFHPVMKPFNWPPLFNLHQQDYVSPYYRDESILLGLGFSPEILMLQLLAKGNDIFTGGKCIIHIRITGAQTNRPSFTKAAPPVCRRFRQPVLPRDSLSWKKQIRISNSPLVLCSFGDASITEGEVSEAFQFAVLKKLPIIYLVQDNEWGISVTSEEARSMDAFDYAAGFPGMERIKIDGSDFEQSFNCMQQVFR